MHNTHVIDPVTRIEGHAKITLHVDDAGGVSDARFHVTEFRGFEEFCRGRPLSEMPGLTARTCGICPVSHLIASAKAGDAIHAVAVPEAAALQRRLANLGQMIQSHALSVFHLSAPDLLLGMDADPAQRNVFGLMAAEPDLVRRGIRLRQFGQEVIASVAGKAIHGAGIVHGGVAAPFTVAKRDALVARLDEAHAAAKGTLELIASIHDRFPREMESFGTFPSLFLGHCGADGTWEHLDGRLRIIDPAGAVVVDGMDPADYREVLGEAANVDSFLKSPYYKPLAVDGDPVPGMYRVGPLARVNLAERFGVPAADQALAEFRERFGRIPASSFLFHYARLLEILASVELIAGLLHDQRLLDEHVRAEAGINRRRGVGASEAPRGTLFHDYSVDEHGVVTDVNMLIATGQNNLAMNRTLLHIAREFVDGPEISEGTLNRLEAGIRAFDPCLSCSTHALGQMPMVVEMLASDGRSIASARRE